MMHHDERNMMLNNMGGGNSHRGGNDSIGYDGHTSNTNNNVKESMHINQSHGSYGAAAGGMNMNNQSNTAAGSAAMDQNNNSNMGHNNYMMGNEPMNMPSSGYAF